MTKKISLTLIDAGMALDVLLVRGIGFCLFHLIVFSSTIHGYFNSFCRNLVRRVHPRPMQVKAQRRSFFFRMFSEGLRADPERAGDTFLSLHKDLGSARAAPGLRTRFENLSL